MNPARKFFGLVTRKERWGLSWRGWLALIFLLLLAGLVWMLNVQPFLAQTKRVDTKILVVEGWVELYTINAAVAEIQTGRYEKIYTTGGPVPGTDGATNDYNTLASVGADRLVRAGVPAGLVQMVPSHELGRDRTYSSAVALRDWFRAHNVTAQSVNVLTEDAHGRRTRMLFQAAFGRDVTIGVIAVPDPAYDPKRWWCYSEGVREVLGESIAYLYAEFFFHPAEPRKQVS